MIDVEAGGLFADDGARLGSVGVGWMENDGEIVVHALPFDQGERDKFPSMQMDLFAPDDPNLPEEDWWYLLDWLSRRGLVAHNYKYDAAMVEVGTRLYPGRRLLNSLRWDTLLAQRQLDPTELGRLEDVGPRLGLGEKVDSGPIKAWLKKHKYPVHRYDLAPWDLIRPYLIGDVELEVKLCDHQLRRIKRGEVEEWVAPKIGRELDLLKVLYQMEDRGIAYDLEASLDAADELERRADEIEAGMPFECTPNAAKDWFYKKQGLTADRYTDNGAPSLDEEQVREWVRAYEDPDRLDRGKYQWAREYELVSKMRRAVSMWYRGYPEKAGPDGRLRTYYKQAHVKSGRMSVQRIQLQAIPKNDKALDGVPNVRSLIRAKEGHGLWNLDLSQAELRVAAKYSGCNTVLRMLEEGVDFHGVTTERVIGIERTDPLWKEKRDIAKRLNFGAIFQIGGEKFQATLSKLAGIHLPIEECDRLVREWRTAYPEFQQAYYKAMRLFESRGFVYLLPRTKYQVPSYMGKHDYPNTAWNRVVQGSLAEFLKLWLVEVERRWPDYMVLTIHDSIVIEALLDEGDQLAGEIAEWTAEFAGELFRVPMLCDISMWTRTEVPV